MARYEDLFTREQYAALRDAEAEGEDDERERIFRLREACGGGVVVRELAEEADRLENDILACRITFAGEEPPLRTAQAKLAVLDGYDERDELGTLAATPPQSSTTGGSPGAAGRGARGRADRGARSCPPERGDQGHRPARARGRARGCLAPPGRVVLGAPRALD